MRPTALINVVGLCEQWLPHAPRIASLGRATALRPVFPAVTCSVQASMLTGLPVEGHGIVANGWYERDEAAIRFWQRSGRLMQGEPIWETARQRNPAIKTANLFWRYAAYGGADIQIIERPIYKADGRKLQDIYCNIPALRDELQSKLGTFPLFHFWGPMADIRSSRWIADAAKHVHEQHRPELLLVYLPHLDYCLQKLGPEHADIPRHVAEIDEVAGDLIDTLHRRDVRVIVVSEYGIEAVDQPVMINQVLRRAGFLRVREEDGGELLDAGACEAFAVADHQAAHVYVSPARRNDAAWMAELESLCCKLPGVEAAHRIAHPRAGELVLEAATGSWFAYDYWLDAARAPDFARTVAIHDKPGYDPRELYLGVSKAAVAWKMLRKKLGFRQLLDVVPLDAARVRGSHGRRDNAAAQRPVMLGDDLASIPETKLPAPPPGAGVDCMVVHDVVLDSLMR